MAIANSDGSIVLSLKISTQKAIGTLRGELAKISQGKNAFNVLSARAKQLQTELKSLEKEYAILISQEQALAGDAKYEAKLSDLGSSIRNTKRDLADVNSALGALSKKATKSFSDISKGLKNFGKRIAGIIKSALVFSFLYKAMQSVVNLFKNILMSDEEFRQDWEELKAAFYTAAYPIVNLIVPAIKWIVQQVRDWAVSIGNVAAALQGMSYSQLVDQAESSKETADNYDDIEKKSKKIAKNLAPIDDIQILSSGNNEEQSAGVAGFEGLKEYDASGEKSVLNNLMRTIGGALAAIGIILIFKGIFTWGIGFLVAGAAIWAINKFAEGKFSEDPIVNTLVKIMGIAGTSLLAIGIILCVFSGINPISIGLIIAGAAMLVGAFALNNESIVEAIRGPIGAIMAIAGASLLVIGIILTCSGNFALGIPLIAAGAMSLGTPIALNWDAIIDKVRTIGKAIGDIFKVVWDGIVIGFKFMVNGIISLANLWITELNLLLIPIRAIVYGVAKAFGSDISFGDIKIPHIPKLAQGAVLPPNKPFLAMVGDQKHGTNIEAPLQTIVDAFNIALSQNGGYNGGGNTEVVLEIDGREFGRAVVEQGNRENRRIGTRLVIV